MELIMEFVSYVESGFGFIYEKDIVKYYEQIFQEPLSPQEKERILNVLRDKNLLKEDAISSEE